MTLLCSHGFIPNLYPIDREGVSSRKSVSFLYGNVYSKANPRKPKLGWDFRFPGEARVLQTLEAQVTRSSALGSRSLGISHARSFFERTSERLSVCPLACLVCSSSPPCVAGAHGSRATDEGKEVGLQAKESEGNGWDVWISSLLSPQSEVTQLCVVDKDAVILLCRTRSYHIFWLHFILEY